MDGTAQEHRTETIKNNLQPKWNTHFDLLLAPNDSITISVWNEKQSNRPINHNQQHKLLGCVKLNPNAIERLKNTGYQRLTLANSEPVKGQIVISLMSRDTGPHGQIQGNYIIFFKLFTFPYFF